MSNDYKLGKVRNVQHVEGMEQGHDAEAIATFKDGSQQTMTWSRRTLESYCASRIRDGYLTVEIKGRVSLELFYKVISDLVGGGEISKEHFVSIALPYMMPGQVRVVNMIAKGTSPIFRGCVQVRLVNPVKSA